MAFTIGIISDTHGLLRPEAERRLTGVDHIIHVGDIGCEDIVAKLGRIAPVTAIRGDVDTAKWADRYPETATVRLADRKIFVLHDLKTMSVDPIGEGNHLFKWGKPSRPSVIMLIKWSERKCVRVRRSD